MIPPGHVGLDMTDYPHSTIAQLIVERDEARAELVVRTAQLKAIKLTLEHTRDLVLKQQAMLDDQVLAHPLANFHGVI